MLSAAPWLRLVVGFSVGRCKLSFTSVHVGRATCAGQSVPGKGLSPNTYVFPSHYHSTSVLYSFMCDDSYVILAADSVVKRHA